MLDVSELNKIEKLAQSKFKEQFDKYASHYKLFTTEVHDIHKISLDEILNARPTFRARYGNKFDTYEYQIKNQSWNMDIHIPYIKLWASSDLSSLTNYTQNSLDCLIQQFRKEYPSNVIIKMLEAGEMNLAYDGLPFFSEQRSTKNLLIGHGTTTDQIKQDLAIAQTAMRGFKDPNGQKLNFFGNLVIIPPELEMEFMNITKDMNNSSSVVNNFQYYVDARLQSETDWYLIATAEFIKPFVFHERIVDIRVKDHTFENRFVQFCISGEGDLGYTIPEMCIKIKNANDN